MAKDDYFVLAYRALAYLYACLKSGQDPDMEYLDCETKDFPVGQSYWAYLIEHLAADGYIEGVAMVPIAGRRTKGIKILYPLRITPKGIAYLQENTSMRRAADFLKSVKEMIPGL